MMNIRALYFSAFMLSALLSFAQPANDNCSGAQNIGTLPAPAACPSGVGSAVSIAGTLTGATPGNPYIYQNNCSGAGGPNMGVPANDVWYTFTASGYQCNITINSTFANPNVAFYSGTCAALGGGIGGCAVGSGGTVSLTVNQMVPGTTYYIQVSGNTGQTGTFNMSISNNTGCSDCLNSASLTVNPQPVNGMYQPGQTVNFCFHVNQWTQVNTNWLHGVQLAFGSGWNLGSLTTTAPPPCSGSGTWSYYPGGCTSSATGTAWPAGFYFETSSGASCLCTNTNPGDNFGDNCQGTISAANWKFCFSIQVANGCNPGSALSVTVSTTGDGESGVWSNNGCTNDPPALFNAVGACCPPTMASTPVSCFGGADGSATATPVGTASPYSYSWVNSSNAVVSSSTGVNGPNTATGLPAGTYTVTITDKNNCASTNTVTVTQPTAVAVILTPTNPSCGNSNGSISASASGGTPGYTYSLNGGAFSGTATFPNLAAGTYTVTVNDSKSCATTATVTLNSTSSPTVTVNNGTICNGGSVTLTAAGASTYSWSPGTGLSGTTGASVTANPPSTTTYTVTGTSSGGCVNTATTTVTVVTNPTITVGPAIICTGGSATLTASGATTYTWSPATGLSSTTGTSVTANPTSTTTYTINGSAGTCTAVATTTVTVNPLPAVTVNSGTICAGQTTATLTAGGASTYSWSPGTGLSGTTGASVTANPSSTTSYTVTGTDANGCVNTVTTSVTVNPQPTVTVNNGTICNGGSVTLTASGASTYAWSPGTGLSGTTGSSVTANPASTTSYTITATDVNGCTNNAVATVTVVTNPVVSVSPATICAGQQTATLTATGATTYSWNPGTGLSATTGSVVTANPATTTVYTVTGTVGTCTAMNTTTVTVNNLPPVSVNSGTICVGETTATLTAAGASTYTWSPATGLSSSNGSPVTANPTSTTSYTVTGTDANGCVNTATTSVTVNPLPLVTATSATICPTFSATLTAAGASTYTWNTGTTGSSLTQSPASTTSYTVAGTDANGCINAATATITVNSALIVAASSNAPVCQGATLTFSASTGVSWSWSGPGAFSSTSQNPSIPNATPAMSGTYTVTATDANGCQGSSTVNVTINPLPTPTASSNSPLCVNQNLNLTSTGGTMYAWTGPAAFSSAQQNPTVNSVTTSNAGVYTVTVTDGNGCVDAATVSVTVNSLPVVTATGSTVCLNQTISLSSAPNGAGSYSWAGPNSYSSNQQNPTIPNATVNMSGSYVVTVTDLNGCVNANVAQVTVNQLPVITVTSGTICAGKSTTLTASGATSYAWAPPAGLSSTTGATVSASLNATSVYTVTGTDNNGCQSVSTTTLTVNPVPNVVAGPLNTSGCVPLCVTFTNTGTSAGSCNWSFGDGNISAGNCSPQNCFQKPGTYTIKLTLTDANGCVDSSTASVTAFPIPHADFSASPQPTTILDPEIQFTDLSSNATITGWHWSMGDNSSSILQNPTHLYSDTGTYAVQLVVISDHGCKDSITKTVDIQPSFTFYIPNAFSPNEDGINESFKGTGMGIDNTTYNLWIFDRWGMMIFYSNDLEKSWDGRIQGKGGDVVQEDVYVWKVHFHDLNGKIHEYKGTVSVIK